ncbi:beta-ketoacyl synthase N-terminal-like domain-containing protein [Streptomyces sp. NRRL WC-3742]|uniref:beta-ketoacyl synthase N-terminal-like domain-containing protein n=1 Tax=Streptomyces sp. NRRL WC-3742 TaxID=1463934 RepID=UPI0018FE3940|nr:beta-ketoacyl synthase N-terminal-like domain-containing protein [Streptomyces sp. NRRL WC-3742]
MNITSTTNTMNATNATNTASTMTAVTTAATAYGLRVIAEARADDDAAPPPPLPGFASSGFNPLVAEVADRCLAAHHGQPPAPGRTALLLASTSGDRATARAIDESAEPGRRPAPLLFFQSNPNAVLGHIAARWGLTGPVVAIRPAETAPGRIPADALDHAALLIADGDADRVLVIAAEETAQGPHRAVAALLAD